MTKTNIKITFNIEIKIKIRNKILLDFKSSDLETEI